MKLVEIKDIRIGQIWKIDKNLRFVVGCHQQDGYWWFGNSFIDDGDRYKAISCYKTELKELVGFIGITHEIKDNKLVEIPNVFKNAKIHSDDIVIIRGNEDTPFLVDSIYNPKKYDAYISLLSYHEGEFSEEEVEKIGTLGVTHEFVNERLAK